MTVLLVGSGGREHALAMAIAASPECERLVIAPGNAGMSGLGEIADVALEDIDGLCALGQNISADLVVIGPEAPLAAGLADRFRGGGILCFGPSARAARIESSKAFSKSFMRRHGIPTAEGLSFTDANAAKAWARKFGKPLVVKASGLAAGKGVIVPESPAQTEAAIDLLAARGEIVLEERLEGEEISLIALCDGKEYAVLPAARDHKRLLDGDKGPNTGGMGAYAPACSMEEAEALARLVIAPALKGLAEEGSPFVGALYAGLMLTEKGPMVLEYNARFGDPETTGHCSPCRLGRSVATLAACARGEVGRAMPRFTGQHAACVVLASEGYPEHPVKGRIIRIGKLPEGALCFHAGTRMEQGNLVGSGGRVLSLVGVGATREEALRRAYGAAEKIYFDGMQYRRDIGERAVHVAEAVRRSLAAFSSSAGLESSDAVISHECAAEQSAAEPGAYARAGVDIDAGTRAVELMKEAVRSTYGPEVIAGIGAFGGQFDALRLKKSESPVLVASTDGVGTKTSLALKLGRLKGLGHDMVNHSIDDILVQGARPLFLWTTSLRRCSTPQRSPTSSAVWPKPAARQGVRFSEGRPPRCRARTATVKWTSREPSSASPRGSGFCLGPILPKATFSLGSHPRAFTPTATRLHAQLRTEWTWIRCSLSSERASPTRSYAHTAHTYRFYGQRSTRRQARSKPLPTSRAAAFLKISRECCPPTSMHTFAWGAGGGRRSFRFCSAGAVSRTKRCVASSTSASGWWPS